MELKKEAFSQEFRHYCIFEDTLHLLPGNFPQAQLFMLRHSLAHNILSTKPASLCAKAAGSWSWSSSSVGSYSWMCLFAKPINLQVSAGSAFRERLSGQCTCSWLRRCFALFQLPHSIKCPCHTLLSAKPSPFLCFLLISLFKWLSQGSAEELSRAPKSKAMTYLIGNVYKHQGSFIQHHLQCYWTWVQC